MSATMASNDSTQPTCQNCTTSTTPLWRRDEIGSVLCNACGLFLKLHGRARPISLKTDVIKSRNRVKTSGQGQGQKKKVIFVLILSSVHDLTRNLRVSSTAIMALASRDRKRELHPRDLSVIVGPHRNPKMAIQMARIPQFHALRRLLCTATTAATSPLMIPIAS